MSTTPFNLNPVAAELSSAQPDTQWEYLELTVRPHTNELINQYRKVCLMAVNNNIIKFHQNTTLLNYCLENLLTIIGAAEQALNQLHPRHAGRVGNACDADNIQAFLGLHEEYVAVQAMLLNANNAFFVPLDGLVTEAHQRAVAAQQLNKGNV